MDDFESRFVRLAGRARQAVGRLEEYETDALLLTFERRLERLRSLKLKIPLPEVENEEPPPEIQVEAKRVEEEAPAIKALRFIFAPRAKWADSRKMIDTDETLRAAMSLDWDRTCATKGFVKLVVKVDDDASLSAAHTSMELEEVKEALV